ncbi:universal stress protein UspA [Acidaminobacter sp. JC074]|uniref:universal stress protein n=1 Tax=Acidaminobacter sp. JC074 TaxID=2530199 RepID=UPI001F102E86|nr:universal stress protein [Acidaminobacter sp. JC074]MCH4891101.1 universal stress protein UspA [Acidaminobacter sp. JC074]
MENNKIMVCVTQQKLCKRLIHRAHNLKKHEEDELFVIHVVKENWKYFGQLKEADALEYLFDSAKEYGATLNVFKAKDIEGTLADFAEKESVDVIVMGESLETSQQQNMINRLQERTKKQVMFDIVAQDYEMNE